MHFHFEALGVGADLGVTLSRRAPGSGEVESVSLRCPGWGGPGRTETLAPTAEPGPACMLPVAPVPVGGPLALRPGPGPACCVLLPT